MFGNAVVELKYDLEEILFLIDDSLKEHGISHFNNVSGNRLKGYGDAGMGIFEIEKKRDKDKKTKLFITANSKVSVDILENVIHFTFDQIEEKGLDTAKKEETQKESTENSCSFGKHELEYLKTDEIAGMQVNIFICKNCSKIEFFKAE